jgi:hypothetical protein
MIVAPEPPIGERSGPHVQRVHTGKAGSAVVLCLRHLLKPGCIDSPVVRLLHCEVNHGVIGRSPVPVPLIRWNHDCVARPNRQDVPTLALHPSNPGQNMQHLAEWVSVPSCTSPGLKGDAISSQARRRRGNCNGVQPNRPGKVIRAGTHSRPLFAAEHFHRHTVMRDHSTASSRIAAIKRREQRTRIATRTFASQLTIAKRGNRRPREVHRDLVRQRFRGSFRAVLRG